MITINKEEFTERLDEYLDFLRSQIERNHKLTFGAPKDGEMYLYEFQFSDEKGLDTNLVKKFLEDIRTLSLRVFDELQNKYNYAPNPIQLVTIILQKIAHKYGEIEERN